MLLPDNLIKDKLNNIEFKEIKTSFNTDIRLFFPYLLEIRLGYGETWQQLSKTDLPHAISDTSIGFGIGSPVYYLGPGNFDLFFYLNYSKYGNDGQGEAYTPLLNFLYSSDSLLFYHGFYGGFGIGPGRDTMKINRYANKWKWTIDIFLGLKYFYDKKIIIKYGLLLRHKSHSFIGPWKDDGTNVGYNELMFDITYQYNNFMN